MEEVQPPQSSASQLWVSAAYVICSQIVCRATRLQGLNSGKNFFVSIAHEFLERIIHLHCPEIKKILVTQAKELEKTAAPGNYQISPDFKALMQETMKLNEIKLDKKLLLSLVSKLFTHLVCFQCQGRSSLDVQNVFLEISCSLNYACPLCIKKTNSDQPQSIKLIKNYSEEPETSIYPRTMKTISLKEPENIQKLPIIQRTSRLDSILNSMKAERSAVKKQEQTKQKKINKIWNMLGNLIQLDRQKFIVDHIFGQNQGKQNILLKQLLYRNVKNKMFIRQFSKKKRHNLAQPIPSIANQDIQQVIQKRKQQIQRKNLRSISPKHAHRKLSGKKKVKILEPISNNTTSVDLCARIILGQSSIDMPPDSKSMKVVMISQNQALMSNSKQTKVNYFKRSFKSSKDMLATVEGNEFADYSDRPVVAKSLKII